MNSYLFLEKLNAKYPVKIWDVQSIDIIGPSEVSENKRGTFSYCDNSKTELVFSNYKIYILTEQHAQKLSFSQKITNVITCDCPRLGYAHATEILFSAKFRNNIKLWDGGSKAFELDNSFISEKAFVAQNVKIGKNVVVEPFSILNEGTEIGDNCIIHSGAVIGCQGFGFQRDSSGKPHRIYHNGGVKINEGVEIGANTTICSGTISPTFVDSFTKIDGNVFVAHNVQIGKNCLIAGSTDISGSVTIGDNVWIGPGSVISSHISIGSNAEIVIGSVVGRNVKTKEVFARPRHKVI